MTVLPIEYQMTGTGERFLLFDSGVGNTNRMSIFATNGAIVIHANSSQCFGDSIFKLCPQIFSQIYTIHVLVNCDVSPCVNAYSKCFTADGYIRLFFPSFIEAYPTCWVKRTLH